MDLPSADAHIPSTTNEGTAMKRLINITIILTALSACSSMPPPNALERNVAPLSIKEVPQCKKVKLVYTADGSLWIK